MSVFAGNPCTRQASALTGPHSTSRATGIDARTTRRTGFQSNSPAIGASYSVCALEFRQRFRGGLVFQAALLNSSNTEEKKKG